MNQFHPFSFLSMMSRSLSLGHSHYHHHVRQPIRRQPGVLRRRIHALTGNPDHRPRLLSRQGWACGGVVSNKAERVTEFYLDDGTGQIDCHRWMNESIDSKEMEEIRSSLLDGGDWLQMRKVFTIPCGATFGFHFETMQ
ncbi:hypothetical protein Scep_019457 [Stephania cephalantha]|uniref:Uncharacterized protein n=1 Tax=Stephania cephalantha TaxID=152367 RepID=A0AAP0NM58_9MAGN